MPRPKATSEDLERRKETAQDWKLFRKNNFFTQRRLAEIIGISRRTVQLVEGEYVTPHMETMHRFMVFRKKYDRSADFNLQA